MMFRRKVLIRSEKILNALRKSPRLLAIEDKYGGDAVCLLSLDKDERIKLDYSLGWNNNGVLSGNNFIGTFDGGFAFINCGIGDEASKSVAYKFQKHPMQSPLDYNYLLLSPRKKLVKDPKYSRLILAYQNFFIGIDENDMKPLEYAISGGKVKLGFTTSESWHRFPSSYVKKIDTVWIEVKFNKNKTVNELEYYRSVISQFITSKSGQVLDPFETLFAKKKSKVVDELSNYTLYLNNDSSLPDNDLTKINENRLVDLKTTNDFVKILTGYINRFQDMQPAVNLHAAYIKFREEAAYIDSQLSFLFSGIDAMYDTVYQKTLDEERGVKYDNFLTSLKESDIKISKSLNNFISKGKAAYKSDTGYNHKLKKVSEYADIPATDKWVTKVAKLRNSIAHGKPVNWAEFMTNFIDEDGERIEKIDPDKLASILLFSIQKFSTEQPKHNTEQDLIDEPK